MNKAQSLIEILIVIMLLALLIPPLFMVIMSSRDGKLQQAKRLEATGVLKETQEALRIIRENGWSAIATNGTYHPSLTGSTWNLSSGTEVSNGIMTKVDISDVYRENNQIVTTGGTLDPSTKRIDITISWSNPIPSNITSTMYLTRYLENGAYQQTTKAEFDTGILSNLQTTLDNDGEIKLASNTKAKWCDPHLSPVTIDLPGKPIAVDATEGHVYAATGEVAQSSTESFAHVLVSNTDPPSFTLQGKFKGYKTYDVVGEPDYAYISTSDNSKEVVIIDLNQYADPTNKIYQEAGYFNTQYTNWWWTTNDTNDAQAVYVLNNRGYVTSNNYLYVFDLSSKSGSRPQIGSRISFANSGDSAGEIYGRVVGSKTYIYVSVQGSTVDELKIIDVTNPSGQWGVVGGLNIEPNNCSTLESGKAIFVNPSGDRAYISSVNDATFKEFFIIDTSNKSSPSLVGGFATNPPCTNGGGYEAGGMDPEQSAVVSLSENRAILVGTDTTDDGVNAEEYQVLDISNESTPTRCGGMQFDQGIYGIAAVKETDGDTYAYLITGDLANELKVVQGGPDGAYSESGMYESATFDAGYSTIMNYLDPDFIQPANTSVQFQIGIADPINGSCNGVSFTFTGPDGTNGTYYTASDMIALDDDGSGYENPGRCFRYRAFLSTSDYNQTPVLEQVTVNYSP